jgi:hypothetical protein
MCIRDSSSTISAASISASSITSSGVIYGATLSVSSNAAIGAALSVSSSLTVGGAITTGNQFTASLTVSAANFTTAGVSKAGSFTTSGGITSGGTVDAGSFTTSGAVAAATLSGSSTLFVGSTVTFSTLNNTGANDFLGYGNGGEVVELTAVDAASILGLPSSITVKEGVSALDVGEAANTLSKLEVVRYTYTRASGQDTTRKHVGFIAEAVVKVFPEGGATVGPKTKLVPSVSDRDLLGLTVATVQGLQKQVDRLKASALDKK